MTRVLSVTSVRISLQKSNPPTILVEASGTVGTPGWKNVDLVSIEGELSPDGILDLELSGTPPTGPIIQVVRDVTGDFVITNEIDRIVGVMVHSRTNMMSALLGATNPGGPSPGVSEFQAATAFTHSPGTVTTFAIGEEGPPIDTQAVGEGGPPITTRAIGEEGPIKTLAIGEDGPPWWPTTFRFGEEGQGTLSGGETPPLSFQVETVINKPWQADVQIVPPDRPFPDPGPLVNPFGFR